MFCSFLRTLWIYWPFFQIYWEETQNIEQLRIAFLDPLRRSVKTKENKLYSFSKALERHKISVHNDKRCLVETFIGPFLQREIQTTYQNPQEKMIDKIDRTLCPKVTLVSRKPLLLSMRFSRKKHTHKHTLFAFHWLLTAVFPNLSGRYFFIQSQFEEKTTSNRSDGLPWLLEPSLSVAHLHGITILRQHAGSPQ